MKKVFSNFKIKIKMKKITTLLTALLLITVVGMSQETNTTECKQRPSFAVMLADYMSHVAVGEISKAEVAWKDLVKTWMGDKYDAKKFDELKALPTPPPPPGGGSCIVACQGAYQLCLQEHPGSFGNYMCSSRYNFCVGQCGH